MFGGTGTVGAAVLHGLAQAGIPTVFAWHQAEERALSLERELGHTGVRVDLADSGAARRVARESAADVFIHCAASNPGVPFAQVDDGDWHALVSLNCQSAFVACQELLAGMVRNGGGHVVFIGALDRAQALPLPVLFAASHGMLSALTMALAKQLGPQRILVNMVALGVLEGGLASSLDPGLVADYKTMSALRRLGRAEEAAQAALWLALENTYMSGKVLAVNGGI